MNEQQLHMINPYSNELRPEQRSNHTFFSRVDAKKKIVPERREQLSCIHFFYSLVLKRKKEENNTKKKDITGRDNIDA